MLFLGMILGFIISEERKLLDPKKIHAIVNMPPPKNPQHIQIFNGMAQFYKCFIKKFVAIMAPIIKLTRNIKTFLQTKECQEAWESIKQRYIEAPVLISPNQQVEFHVHTNASLLTMGVMLSQNIIRKKDQPIVYVSRFLNIREQIYSITKKERLQHWFFVCKNSNIICWAISLFFMWIIWHWSIWSTNHKFQREYLNGCYCSSNMISQQCINQVELMQLQMHCQDYRISQNPHVCLIKPHMQICFI